MAQKNQISGIYFDKQDRAILALVNHILDAGGEAEQRLLNRDLHPHGIKEMVAPPVERMASAVVNLLRNIDVGSQSQAEDRLRALQILYGEVMNSAHSSLRRNTARVLMQIMKDMVRAQGKRLEQLKLAHDFRRVVHGTPRIVRAMLSRYHLPEMPESWNQLAFDDHVYDANTKGRKNPTHLIMDAWIKGISSLTVAYEYAVDANAARELLRAAEITGITVRVGLEFHMPFYGNYVSLLWIPRGFSSHDDFIAFLSQPGVVKLMEEGRQVLEWRKKRLLRLLAAWNETLRAKLAVAWQVDIPELTEDAFLRFVGRSKASHLHLAECLHRHILEPARQRALILAREDTPEARAELQTLEDLTPEIILEDWLSHQKHPELPDTSTPGPLEDMPPLLRKTLQELTGDLLALNSGYRLVLGISSLTVLDVAELLWDCRGAVTHLEIFNMKGWMEGKLGDLEAIGELQRALTLGLGPRVKQLLREMLARLTAEGDTTRAAKFSEILQHVPILWEHYRNNPLKSRMGTSSAGRLSVGMGLVITDTLPRRAVTELRAMQKRKEGIPIHVPVEEGIVYRKAQSPSFWQRLGNYFSDLPGCHHLGMDRRTEWSFVWKDMCVIRKKPLSPLSGNVANLGGLNTEQGNNLLGRGEQGGSTLDLSYLNTTLSNWLKILIGLIPAYCSYFYVEGWSLLACVAPLIWFGITGFRNVVQMVVTAKGFSRGTLLHWKEQVNVSRLCDSLMYTGISILFLEAMVRVWLLQDKLHITVADSPLVVYTVLNVVNGLYIFSHNIFRGFPRQAAIGNIFRSVLAIPVATFYNAFLFQFMVLVGMADPAAYLIPSAAIISKAASDTVAALIEGYADSRVNLRMRRVDFENKIQNILSYFTRLELLFPTDDVLSVLSRRGGLKGRGGERGKKLEHAFIINALDMMYCWYYQPRAQDALRQIVLTLPQADRVVLARAQLVLSRDREISQLLVDGLLGRNFSRPLSFFLDKHRSYLRHITRLCLHGKAT